MAFNSDFPDRFLRGELESRVNAITSWAAAISSETTLIYRELWAAPILGALGVLGCTADHGAAPSAPDAAVEDSQPGAIEQIEVGADQACAVMTNGSLRCWGSNTWGQLGTSMWGGYSVPTEIPGIIGVEKLHMAAKFSCGIFGHGSRVRCWGDDSEGDLGDGDPGGVQLSPVDVLGIDGIVTKVSSTCALLEDGGVTCWGWGLSRAERVEFIQGAVDISGYCAITADGRLTCWNAQTREIGELVELGDTLAEVTLGWDGKCVRHASGGVACAGENDEGFLGQGTLEPIDGWVQVPLEPSLEIGAGLSHVCSRTEEGALLCWGDNWYGQMGLGSSGGKQSAPVLVDGVHDVRDVAVGANFTCALTNEPRQVFCWGDNDRGQCGVPVLGEIEVTEPTPVVWSE